MIYPLEFEHKVGFDAIRTNIEHRCDSEMGRIASAENIFFSSDPSVVKNRLYETAEMMTLLSDEKAPGFNGFHDLTPILAKARIEGAVIQTDGFLTLHASLLASESLRLFFNKQISDNNPYPLLTNIAAGITGHKALIDEIDRIIDPKKECRWNIRDNASAQLTSIRQQLRHASSSLSNIMKRIIGRAASEGIIDADAKATVRDGRLVIAVAPMNKRKIPGIVHDESATGRTVYIEPTEMVEANNRIRELEIEEKHEIHKILLELTSKVSPYIDSIETSMSIAGYLDFVHAKAIFCSEIGCELPNISDTPIVEWFHAVNPGLLSALKKQGKSIVPTNIQLTNKEGRILIISGPNAGGKSVTLKTVAVNQYMMQSGILPAAYSNSHFGIFENIFLNIGDDQSIEDDLSTYSSHLRAMKYFVQNGNASTLLLIDEFGSGTEPQIGGAIAQALLKVFNEKKMWGVITTHFQNLKQFAEETEGIVNGSMIYDRHRMSPTFELTIGNPGSSFALEIARKTGLPKDIVDDAEKIAGSDYVNIDRYLLEIARDKKYWANKRDKIKQTEKKIESVLSQYEHEAETLREKRREIISEAKENARKIIEESNATVERTIREIRNVQAEKEKTKELRQQLEREKSALNSESKNHREEEHPLLKKAPKRKNNLPKTKSTEDQRPFAPGDNVKLDNQNTVGTILEIEGKNAIVNFGLLKTTVSLNRLSHTLSRPKSLSKGSLSFVSTATASENRDRQLNFKQEIDVRGMRVDEAVQAVTYFIDDAIRFSASKVRILHGTGTGALRQYIRQYLTNTLGVKKFYDEDVRFGGAGITVVELD